MMSLKKQRGQAMTETLITASTVLVPMMLLIPLLGKYIDIKHATIQAARYEAWEYTVWYSTNSVRYGPWSNGERSSGFQNLKGSNLPQPIKSVTALQNESRKRFFSNTDSLLTGTDASTGWVEDNANPLWKDHNGLPLWDGEIPANTTTRSSLSTPDYTGGVMNTLLRVIDAVFGAIAYALKLIGGSVGFTAMNTKGLSKSDLVVPVSVPAGIIDFPTITDAKGVDNSISAFDLEFKAGAAVLTDGWNSGGLMHTTNQVGGITPTKILDSMIDTLIDNVPGLGIAYDVATVLIPEWRRCNPDIPHFLDESYDADENFKKYQNDGSLWLGYINIDAVHPDRLDIGGTESCEDGICLLSYQDFSPCN